MPNSFASSDGLNLSYSDTGSGTPLLCLAGLTRNMDDFEPLLRAIGQEARIIRLDTRGRGGSDHAADFTQYNVQREGQDALDLLDHLGIARAVFLGTSRGGLITMALAPQHGDRLAGAILNDIGPEIDPAGLGRIFGYLGVPPPFATHEEAAEMLQAAEAATFPGVSRERWLQYARALWTEGPHGLQLRYDPALRRALLEGTIPMPDLWQGFDALAQKPLAVIRGANSDILSAQTLAAMQARAPGIFSVTVPDRGHVPFLDESECLLAIRTILKRVSA